MAKVRAQAPAEREFLKRFAVQRDPLSQVTDQVRLTNLFCGVIRVTPPFSRTVVVEGFHVYLMTHRQMYVDPLDGTFAPVLLETGDLLVLPRGIPYRFIYPLDAPRTVEATPVHVKGASKPQADEVEFLGMICDMDRVHRNLLLDFLPEVIHLKRRTPGLSRWAKRTVEQLRAEYQGHLPGRSSILSRLAEIVCVEALRFWIQQMPADTKGWVHGLKDERVAMALQAIHKDPGHRWTVASLAHEAGMSRSVFAGKFKALVGESPMEYLARWRMHRAIGLLERNVGNLKSIVEASGYRSPTTFRAAFKRHFGVLPKDYRQR